MDDTVASIRRRYDPRTIRLEPLDSSADLSPLRQLAAVERIDPAAGLPRWNATVYDIRLLEGSDPGAAIRQIASMVTPARLEVARPRLEDIFMSIVSAGREPSPELRSALEQGSSEAAV